jgi:hypothetical protein
VTLEANNLILLGALDNALRNAQEPSLDLLSKIINGACIRVPVLARTETLTRIIRLAEIGAWTEATFALIALELPLWKVRRLAYENGEWVCSLSQQPYLPMMLDDSKPLTRFCHWRCSAPSSKPAAGATWRTGPCRVFLKSRSHQWSTS